MAGTIEEFELVVDGVRAFGRRVPGTGTPVVYCHGNPTHGEDWVPFLERGGPAVAIDMPGWGRSDRPDPASFDCSMYGLSAFLEKCLEQLGVERRKLVVHDWGGLALIGAQRRPELVEELVVIDAVPLLPGFWRRKPIGEILNRITTRSSLALLLRQATGDRKPPPDCLVDRIWRHWDAGTQAAHLALYRHANPDRLATAGKDLSKITCPSLVLWADRDLYLRWSSATPTRKPYRAQPSKSSHPPATGHGSTTPESSTTSCASASNRRDHRAGDRTRPLVRPR